MLFICRILLFICDSEKALILNRNGKWMANDRGLQWESIFNLLFHFELWNSRKRFFFYLSLLNLSKIMINLEMIKEIDKENKSKVHVDQAAHCTIHLLHFAEYRREKKHIYQIHWKWIRNKFGVKLHLFLISFRKPFAIQFIALMMSCYRLKFHNYSLNIGSIY